MLSVKSFLNNASLSDQSKVFSILSQNWKGNAWVTTGNPKGAKKEPKYLILQDCQYSTNRKLLGALKNNCNLLYSFMVKQKDKDMVILEEY